jgi:hypothetical protein
LPFYKLFRGVLYKKYGTRDPFEIMDQMNIVVGETSRYQRLKGYCFMSCKTIYVMISSFLSEEEKKEIIHIIELYNQNKIQEALFRLIKLMSIGKDILDWFDIT